MNKTKIVITGMGAVTPIGIGVEEYWRNLLSCRSGMAPISKFDATDLPVRFAAEVKNFDPITYLSAKRLEAMDDFQRYAFAAAAMALEDGGLTINPYRTGIVVGSALTGMATISLTQREVDLTGQRVGPKFVPKILGNIAAAQIAISYGIKGPSLTVDTACSSGTDAIIMSAMLLKAGAADAVLAVGAESGLGPLLIQSLAKANALSQRNDAPEEASRPFDLDRDGFVIGEGGGAMLLETEEHALARGAAIRAELMGYANMNDGFHIMSPEPEGLGAAVCMRLALESAGLEPEQVGYLNAHGTSTLKGDAAECLAIRRVFGSYADILPVSSIKGATGHLMGACGVTEAIACVQALNGGVLPPTLHYGHPDPDCALDVIPNQPRPLKIRTAVSNTFGFGGQNASLVLGAY